MAEQSKGTSDFKKRLAHKALMPIVATAASALAGYVAKKGPTFFEEQILPKLKDAGGRVGDVASDVPDRAKSAAGSAKSAAGSAGDLAQSLTSRASDAVTGNGSNGSNGRNLSSDELERHLKERADARAERRKSGRRSS